MSPVRIEVVPSAEHGIVAEYYRCELGRDVGLDASQEVVCAREGDTVVGALRLYPDSDALILRTMVVADGRRGQGIGRALLEVASKQIGPRECYCFPWAHLERFYGRIGFLPVPLEVVPAHIRRWLGSGCVPTRRLAGEIGR